MLEMNSENLRIYSYKFEFDVMFTLLLELNSEDRKIYRSSKW